MSQSKIIFLALIAVAVVFELFGDFLFKKWSISENLPVLLFGLLMYSTGTVFWAISLKYETLSQAITIFFILSVIGAIGIGMYFFGEQVSLINKAGILLGVVSIVLMEY